MVQHNAAAKLTTLETLHCEANEGGNCRSIFI